jgi:hypothetical protein
VGSAYSRWQPIQLDKLSPRAEENGAGGDADRRLRGGFWRYDESALAELFAGDGYWRNLFGLSRYFASSGGETVAREILQRASEANAQGFRLDPATLAPHRSVVAILSIQG